MDMSVRLTRESSPRHRHPVGRRRNLESSSPGLLKIGMDIECPPCSRAVAVSRRNDIMCLDIELPAPCIKLTPMSCATSAPCNQCTRGGTRGVNDRDGCHQRRRSTPEPPPNPAGLKSDPPHSGDGPEVCTSSVRPGQSKSHGHPNSMDTHRR